MFSFLEDGLSIDETRVSVLLFILVVTVGFAMYQVLTIGDISGGMLTLLAYEIGAVTGINIADKVAKIKENDRHTKMNDSYVQQQKDTNIKG